MPKLNSLSSLVAGVVLSFAAVAGAQEGTAARAITTPSGAGLEQFFSPGDSDGGFGTRTALWTYTHPSSIPSTAAFSEGAGSLWIGQWLNFQRAQRFDILGTGTPVVEYPSPAGSNAAVSAATAADLAAVLDNSGSAYFVTAYSKGAGFLWTYPFPANLNNAYYYHVKVSRDGTKVACALTDTVTVIPVLYIFDGATGAVLQTWPLASGYAGAVDLTDDGALALVTVGDQARLIDTATGVVVTQQSASGSGGRFVISGNGKTFALGGFNFRIFTKVGATYVASVNSFTAPTSWFGWAIAVSRDGDTVGVLSHDYGASYLKTTTRIFDVPTGTVIGSVTTTGTGSFQDAAAGAAMSDNGNVLAVASWGTQNNVHPEVRVFDRTCTEIASIDTPGSPYCVDVSFDGRYVAAGSKAVHANTNGNGGRVNVIRVRCPADLNGDGFVDGIDSDQFNNDFEAGNLAADYNSDGFVDGIDYDQFNNDFEAGGC